MMENKKVGRFADNLNPDEVVYSKKCAAILANSGKWEAFLNDDKVKSAINVTLCSCRAFDELKSIKSALFEGNYSAP